jgi:hypothetical protein
MAEKEQLCAAIDLIAPSADTFMFPAIEMARDALQNAAADLKHAILLTDGISRPGNFSELAAAMAAAGISVSAIGLGPEVAGSPAGRLLEEIAARGKGQVHFCKDATMLPTVFAIETARAAKIGVVERSFAATRIEPAELLSGIDFARAPHLLGYVETRLKPAAQAVLLTADGDPLLAWWTCGAGRAAAFTSDCDRWAAQWLGWEQFEQFWAEVARFAAGRSSRLAR